MRESGTERPHTSEFNAEWREGSYHCKGCGKTLFESPRKPTSPKSSIVRTAWSELKCVVQGATATSDTCSPTVQPKREHGTASTASASHSILRTKPQVHFLREVQIQSAMPASMVHTEMSSAWVMMMPNKSNVVLTRIFSIQKRSKPLNIR